MGITYLSDGITMNRYTINAERVKYPPEITGYQLNDMQGSGFMQVYSWCKEQFGAPEGNGVDNTWNFYCSAWHFNNEEDYAFFILRWVS